MERYMQSYACVKPFSEYVAEHSDDNKLNLTLIYDNSDDQLHSAVSFIRPCFLGTNDIVLWVTSQQAFPFVMSTLRKQQIMPSLHVVTKKISILSGEQFFDENTLWSPVDVQKRLEPFASFVAEAEASGRGVYIVFEANCLSPMLPHEIEFPLHAFLRLQAEIHKLSSSVPIRTMFTYDTRRIPTASLVGLMICCPSFVFNASYYQNPVYYPHQRIRLSALNSLFLNLWAHQVEASVPCSLVTTGRPPSVSPAATIQSLPTMPHSRQLSPLPADDEEGGEEDDEGWVTEDE